MTTCSMLSVVAQLNKAQAEAVRSMGFASFSNVDLKQIPGKFSKCPVKCFDPYVVCFMLPDGQKFPVTAFDVNMTLGVPFGGRKIINITKSSTDEEYDEMKRGPPAIGKHQDLNTDDEGGCCRPSKCSRGVPKSSTEAQSKQRQWCFFIQPPLLFHKLDSADQISGTTLVANTSVTVKKKDHSEGAVLDQPNNIIKKDDSIPSYSLRLGLSQPNSQSPVPQTTSMPDPSTIRVNEDDGSEDDDDNAPLRFLLRTHLTIDEKMVIAPTAKQVVEQKKGSPRAYGEQQALDSSKPKLAKEVLLEKDHEKRVGAARTPEKSEEVGPLDALRKRPSENLPLAYCSPYVIRLTKLDSKLSQDELVISEYVFGKVEDVDNR
ncbi:hypothetical protein Cgig2_000301 [Carnegiea gigantea]|uniref:Uncharacterized protein n=1 Tax=Carnegiea gigantea TaxID=171969 RepID=A0A9Q1K2K7_9CARY|nr:hypothetical protein Cgig2_000301 [Carnegiea gigantea]